MPARLHRALLVASFAIPYALLLGDIAPNNSRAHNSLDATAAIARINPDVRPYGLRYEAGNRFLAVQVWEWDNDHYDLRVYLTSESAEGICETQVLRSRYYAVTIERLLSLLAEAGFTGVERRDDVLFQPVLLGRRPNAV